MIDFLKSIVELVTNFIEIMGETANRIDDIEFKDSVFVDYLGYAKYAMGTPLYTLFTSVILIGIGVACWNWLVKGIMWIRSLI